jgi:hypothetical protein
VADAVGGEPHERLAALRLGELDVVDDERLSEPLEDGGADLHAAPSGRRVGCRLSPGCRRGDRDVQWAEATRGVDRMRGRKLSIVAAAHANAHTGAGVLR